MSDRPIPTDPQAPGARDAGAGAHGSAAAGGHAGGSTTAPAGTSVGTGARVAVVEDEETLREMMALALRQHGHAVEAYADGRAAADAFDRALPDLALLDINLPQMDGLDLCRRLRARSLHLPIIFVTSREEELDRVLGLELGADDYVCKPFSMRELMARVKVLLRRAALGAAPAPPAGSATSSTAGSATVGTVGAGAATIGTAIGTSAGTAAQAGVGVGASIGAGASAGTTLASSASGAGAQAGGDAAGEADVLLSAGPLRLDLLRYTARWHDRPVALTVTEFLLLRALAQRPGQVKTRHDLMEQAYPDNTFVSDRTIDSHIKRLRRKFEAIDERFDRLDAVYGLGYRFRADE